MESPRKFNDCYFYYYSTCTKGDNCVFRHEPSALGCETMCSAWQQGKCLDKRCKLRHMELRKNRKQIPCYWETQPGGCRKKHCPFMHKNPDARTDGIAPSQPGAPTPAGAVVIPESVIPGELPTVMPAPAPIPAQLPALWQQPRHVELDSAILRVMPAGPAGGPRRDGPHDPVAPYPISVDPFFVSFEEESDNESTPSSTPTKPVPQDDDQRLARSKSKELLALEKIQAEAAAFYSYDPLPSVDTIKERKHRTNLSTKYDRLSLDDIAGKAKLPPTERRNSLDFKVLSLDEIRAKKKITDTDIQNTKITLNLNSRKRKISSTQEAVTTSGNKIIKVVRSNSIVYKKVDKNAIAAAQSKVEVESKPNEAESVSRKRTLSELCADIYDMRDDELVDNCYEFGRVDVSEQIPKPTLIRTRLNSERIDSDISEQVAIGDKNRTDSDSDLDIQIVDDEMCKENEQTDVSNIIDCEIIEIDSTKACEQLEIVDLSDDDDIVTETDMGKNVPDIVASCRQKNGAHKNDECDVDIILYDEI